MKQLDKISALQMKTDLPDFSVGDTVRVFVKSLEADKVRVHPFEGTVIAKKNRGVAQTFTVRKVSYGEGVERIFPLHTPGIDRIEVVSRGKVRRAKLYYLRQRKGKKAKIASA